MPENNEFQKKALEAVAVTVNRRIDGETPGEPFAPGAVYAEDFYVVWFVKVLQNYKALISTDLIPGQYFEVTYNGDRLESYVDWYEKKQNIAIPDIALDPNFHHLSD